MFQITYISYIESDVKSDLMFVISLFHQSLQYICDDFRFENVLDMDRFCATRPVFSAPWLLSDRLRG